MSTLPTPEPAADLTPAGSLIPTEQEDCTIREAISILTQRIFQRDNALCNPNDVRQYLQLKFMAQKRELFGVVYCDHGNRPIAFEILSCGTLTHARVYPREVLERALFHNAASIIVAHNNPSGRTEPSTEDRLVTSRLQQTLELVDVRVLDHIVIGQGEPLSFAEAGLL